MGGNQRDEKRSRGRGLSNAKDNTRLLNSTLVFFRGSSKRRQPLRYGESEPAFLLLAEDHFALAHQLVVEPEAVFVGRGFAAGARRSAEQADSRGRLKNVRGKRAAVHVKLDTQVSRVGNPRNLVAGIQHHGLRNQSNQYRAFCHFVFHPDGPSGRSLLEDRTRSDNSTFSRAISGDVGLP